jgi:hypothetical protein
MALQGLRITEQILTNPAPEAKAVLSMIGEAPATGLLRHQANEQTRANLETWEGAQIVITLTMIVVLVFTDQKKPAAIAMCLAMGALVVIQHYGITPGLNFLGRQADFLAQKASFAVQTQMWTMTRTYGALEMLKLVIGGVLASYFFSMESTVKRSKSRRVRTDDAMLSEQGK